MPKNDKHPRKKRTAHVEKKEESSEYNHPGNFQMSVVANFLFDSAYQIVTWVFIALSIGGIWYFVSKGNYRGTLWSVITLACSVIVMIGIMADHYFFRSTDSPNKEQTASVTERPWIKIEHRIVRPLTFDVPRGSNSVATITLENTIENVGQSVAVNVFVWQEIIPMNPGFDDVLRTAHARQVEACDAFRHPKQSEKFTGEVLFPRDHRSEVSVIDISMSEVAKNVTHGRLGSDGKQSSLNGTVGFAIVGCVYYRSSFDLDNAPTHQTRFLYALGIPDERSFTALIIPKGVASQLGLISFGFGLTAD
jgi:hypothetical protein